MSPRGASTCSHSFAVIQNGKTLRFSWIKDTAAISIRTYRYLLLFRAETRSAGQLDKC